MAGPTAVTNSTSLDSAPPKLHQEMEEKYRSLKRRFQELEEESGAEANRSEERNVRKRQEQETIRAEMTEIEQKIKIIPNGSIPSNGVVQPSAHTEPKGHHGESEPQPNGHSLETLSNAATSPRARVGASENATSSKSRTTTNNHRSQPSADIQMGDATQLPQLANGSQSSPRSSQRIAARRSQRNGASTSSGTSIAAIAAAAAEVEAAASAPTQTAGSTAAANPSKGKERAHSSAQLNASGSVPTTLPTASQRVTSFPGGPNPYAGLASSMESIVRVAEAAVAAQNALKLAGAQPTESPSNLDPTLLAESVAMTSPPSTTPSTSASSSSNLHKKLPSVDTSSIASSSATPAPSATPSSTTSTTSSLTNNPYFALATNYQRGPSASPTGHPLLVPYPFFYPSPSTPVTPGTPTAYIPYNPYYYMAGPVANGMYPPPPGFIPQPPSAPQPQQQPPKQAPSDQRAVKPKRLKSHTVTSKSFSIPMVPRDKQGKPMLPLNVGIMTVISLGTVCMREHFHTERYIFPVGYEVTRRYLSTVDPSVEVVYHCTILDGGDGPKFQIIPSDRPDQPVIAGTATGAWSNIVKQANAIRNRQHSNSVSGPDFFGLGQNTIKHLIQELLNADKLRDYVWQNFVEGGPLGGRHAAVIPALPEEYDASMPIGPYYPRRNLPVPEPNLPRGLSYYPQHIIAQADGHGGGQDSPVAGPSSISAPPMTPLPSASDAAQAAAQQSLVSAINAAVGDPAQFALFGYQPHPAHSISAPPVAQLQETHQTQKRVTRSSAAAAITSTGVASSSTAPNPNARHTRSTSKVQQPANAVQPQQVPEVVVPPPTVDEDDATQMTFAGIMKAYPFPPGATTITISTGPSGVSDSAGS